jgi:tetratricopeptide (TPR) repeat protein
MFPFRSMFLIFCAACSLAAQKSQSELEVHLNAAKQAQSKQDFRTAALEYDAAIHIMPRSAELWSNEGVALYCDNQLPEAIAAFRKALLISPTLNVPHLFIGLASHRLADEAVAIDEFQTFLQSAPNDITARLWLGYAFSAQKEYSSAIEQFEVATRLNGENVDARYALAQSYLELGRQKAQVLVALAPKGPQVLRLASEQYRLSGETAKADAILQEAVRLERDTAITKSNNEEMLYQEVVYANKEATIALQAVVQRSPNSDRAHQIIADALLSRQNVEGALKEYKTVLERNPSLPGVHEAISSCLMLEGNFVQALMELEAEQNLQPRSAAVLEEIGQIQLAMGHDEDAMASLRQALSLGRPPIEIYLLLGKATLRKGDSKGAIDFLEHFIAAKSDVPEAYYLLSRAYRNAGNLESMKTAILAYRRTSRDEEDRNLSSRITRRPGKIQVAMDTQELQDLDTVAVPKQ